MKNFTWCEAKKSGEKCENEISKMKNACTWVESRRWKFNFEILLVLHPALEPWKSAMNESLIWNFIKTFSILISFPGLCVYIARLADKKIEFLAVCCVHVQSAVEGIRIFAFGFFLQQISIMNREFYRKFSAQFSPTWLHRILGYPWIFWWMTRDHW